MAEGWGLWVLAWRARAKPSSCKATPVHPWLLTAAAGGGGGGRICVPHGLWMLLQWGRGGPQCPSRSPRAPRLPQPEGLGVGLVSRRLPEEAGQEGPGRGPAVPGHGPWHWGRAGGATGGSPGSHAGSEVIPVTPRPFCLAGGRVGKGGSVGGCSLVGSPEGHVSPPPASLSPSPRGSVPPPSHSHTPLQKVSVLVSAERAGAVQKPPGAAGGRTPAAPRAGGGGRDAESCPPPAALCPPVRRTPIPEMSGGFVSHLGEGPHLHPPVP